MADHDSRSGTTYADCDIVAWIDALHHPLDPAAQRAFDAPTTEGMPAVQVGRGEGALLIETATRPTFGMFMSAEASADAEAPTGTRADSKAPRTRHVAHAVVSSSTRKEPASCRPGSRPMKKALTAGV